MNRSMENRTTRKFIPSDRSISLIYWLFLIIVAIFGAILSCLKGHFQAMGNNQHFDMIQNLLLIVLGSSQIIAIFCFVKYGRLLVSLLNETVQLSDANDYKNNPTALVSLNRYKLYLTKVNIISDMYSIYIYFLENFFLMKNFFFFEYN